MKNNYLFTHKLLGKRLFSAHTVTCGSGESRLMSVHLLGSMTISAGWSSIVLQKLALRWSERQTKNSHKFLSTFKLVIL